MLKANPAQTSSNSSAALAIPGSVQADLPWYQMSTAQVLAALGHQDLSGLSEEGVEALRARCGPNLLPDASQKSPWKMFFLQFTDLLVLVLLGAALIAGFLGEPADVAAIIAIVFLNAVLGFIQEYRAEKSMQALRKMAAPQARVRRRGGVKVIPARDLVPGDVVYLESGAQVPADLRLVECADLQIDESTFTGESVPVAKFTEALASLVLPVADRKNMAFKGTMVTLGRGIGIVVGTGANTELGKIARLLGDESEVQTPLQRRLANFAKRLAVVVMALCAVIFGVGVLRGEAPLLMFMTALSLAVAAIPEALPAVVTVALALGARVMGRQKALIRKLPAVEALGSVTYICTDKTGTLTENRMQARTFFVVDHLRRWDEALPTQEGPWHELLKMMAQSNDAYVGSDGEAQGDPTETALYEGALAFGFKKDECEQRHPRVAEIPFSSERGMMSTLHQGDGELWLFVKGAPEKILERCSHQLSATGRESLNRETFADCAQQMAQQGLRVLAFAQRRIDVPDLRSAQLDFNQLEQELTLVGLVGLMDPPRGEAKAAVEECHSAGIHVMMLTGDHPQTARAVAAQVGLLRGPRQRVVTGAELTDLSDEELQAVVREVAVCARVAPEQKIRIVKALQGLGEVVAMTGDGVNDAPALRRADIGVAMGCNGTDVAKEAAHMVLLDDNFATIVKAIYQGRRIYDNIRKFVRFALAGNSGEIWTLFLAPFLGLPTPLLPIHILWVNLVTDGLPGLALAMEPAEHNLMKRRPRHPQESIFMRGLGLHTIWVGILIAALTLGVLVWAQQTGAHWQSMAFTVLTLSQMFHVLAIRSEDASIFRIGFFTNLPLLGAVSVTFLLQLVVLYIPAFNSVFKTEALAAPELAICLLVSSLVFVAVEVEKFLRRRFGAEISKENNPLPVERR